MRNILVLVSAAVLASGLSAWAAEPAVKDTATTTHTADSMTRGHHMMPGQKQAHMSNKVMPGFNPNCSAAALAKMPADHRAACHKKD